jgi:hypothetical protein
MLEAKSCEWVYLNGRRKKLRGYLGDVFRRPCAEFSPKRDTCNHIQHLDPEICDLPISEKTVSDGLDSNDEVRVFCLVRQQKSKSAPLSASLLAYPVHFVVLRDTEELNSTRYARLKDELRIAVGKATKYMQEITVNRSQT